MVINWSKLAFFLDPKLGPAKNFTAYLFIYILESYPTIHLYPKTKLPHYPPESYPTIHLHLELQIQVFGRFQLSSAVSEIMWVLVMVVLNMQVGCLKSGPFLTARLDMVSRKLSFDVEVQVTKQYKNRDPWAGRSCF